MTATAEQERARAKVQQIQTVLGVEPDGKFGPKSEDALTILIRAASGSPIPEPQSPPDSSEGGLATRWPLERDAAKFYGRSDGSARWESENLVTIEPPYPLFMDGVPIRRIRCHRLVAASLKRILANISNHYGGDQAAIHAVGMDQFDGCYNFRPVRGANHLSMHAYGAAVDFDSEHNQLGSSKGRMPKAVVDIFKAEGWRWGGDYSGRPDKMHFEACR